jgi:ribosomal protein S18 acetylase RimI-like enzyme
VVGSGSLAGVGKDSLMAHIRAATDYHRDAIWQIFREVIAAGDTYPIHENISRKDALAYWFQDGGHAYVAEVCGASVGQADSFPGMGRAGLASAASVTADASRIVGSYTLHPNQAGGGAHVANAAFIVAKDARGHGIGRALGEHCLHEARRLGFRAMLFNYVVSTNTAAVKLWQDLGMDIVATLPGAFRHPQKGFVDVYVMYRRL